ncbi:MAG: hypothetical protein GXY52_01475 [Chloroflexi bacterium]|nr:hypothetical protein [Chloroflexota bacterium]
MDKLYVVPHTHYDAVVFKTRAEYLEMGLPIILRALKALEEDPRYRFVLDQTCYIKPFLERYPEQEALLRRMLAEGRMQITCGMDTMADVNIPSGESFVRQVLYGKGYARERLGLDITVGWALDTFGHHPQMPQLLQLAGFNSYFFARGVPWPAPKQAEFWWEGIDGTRFLALWLPYSYGFVFGSPGNLTEFSQFIHGRYDKLKAISASDCLLGMAGVDLGEPEPHVSELAEQFNAQPDAPFRIIVASPDEFLTALKEATDGGNTLQVLKADLNPIFQGGYSSRIQVKQANRASEVLFGTVEALDAISACLGLPSDSAALWRAWEPVLFNQFHDCICGVQVDKVFEDTMASYAYAQRLASDLRQERLEALAGRIDTQGNGIAVVVWNTLGFTRDDVVETSVSFTEDGVHSLVAIAPDGSRTPVQILDAQRHPRGGILQANVLFIAREVPALGWSVYHLVPTDTLTGEAEVWASASEQSAFSTANDTSMPREHGALENAYYRLEFDLWSGAMTGLLDKRSGWQALRAPGNVVAREHDGGDFWQLGGALKAGMAVAGVQRQPPPAEGTAVYSHHTVGDGQVRAGAVMAEFNISHPYDSGWIRLRVRLYAGLPRIDCFTELTNREEFVRYRVLFPTTLPEGRITHEIPFGALERPSQELPAQNWMDYSAGTHGLSLLNRGLPGNNTDEGTLMLSLLRASQLVAYGFSGGYEPGVGSASGQDLKTIGFHYALLPHAGDWRTAGSPQQGQALNTPLLAHKSTSHPGDLPACWSLAEVNADNVLLSACKLSADGHLILRLYECHGQPAACQLRMGLPVQSIERADLLEAPIEALPVEASTVWLQLRPFEIITLRISLSD